MGTFDFGWALAQLKEGKGVCREGWYGKHRIELQRPDENSKMNQPYIYITAQNGDVLPWLASQADMLAEDWRLFP